MIDGASIIVPNGIECLKEDAEGALGRGDQLLLRCGR